MHRDNIKHIEINSSCFIECAACQRIFPIAIIQDDGRYYINLNDVLDYRQEHNGFVCFDCQIKKSGAGTMREATIERRQCIIDLLSGSRAGLTIPGIVEETGYNRQTVRMDLLDLESIGLVASHGGRKKTRIFRIIREHESDRFND